MSDRTQEIKNLRAVAVASKNYTDKRIDDLQWQLGTYDLGVETVNGTTKLLPTPANTIQVTMVRVDGKSEVSANLRDLNYTTITYKRNNGTNFVISDSDSNTTRIRTESVPFKPIANKTYYLNNIPSGISLLGIGGFDTLNGTSIPGAITASGNSFSTTRSDIEYVYFLFSGSDFTDSTKTLFNQIGIFETNNTYEPYYSGIHNLELSGLKVEGSNILPTAYSEVTNGTTSGFTNTFDLSIKKGETISIKMFKESGTISLYNFAFYDGATWHNDVFAYNSNNDSYHQSSVTFSYDVTQCKIFCSFSNSPTFKVMLVRGSTAPTTYVPYITPTTKTIDLSTILYNGNPLFEGNSLKAVNDVKDSITPYKATNKLGYVDLGSLTWILSGAGDNARFITLGIGSLILKGTTNLLCTKYTAVSWDDLVNSNDDMIMASRTSDGYLGIRNLAYTDATTFTTAMNGVYLVYELATPIEVSIDFSQLVKFEAYSNGSITLVNTNNQDTTSTFKYLKEVAK